MALLKETSERKSIEQRLEDLELELELIKKRNARVEMDKAWETSKARIFTICALTYLIAAALLYLMGSDRFWLNAVIPACGFYLSSQSLPAIKRWWISSRSQ